MLSRSCLIIVCALLAMASGRAQVIDFSKYPDLTGQWHAIGGPDRFDMSKPAGLGQQAPLTPEYQAIFDASLKDRAAGKPDITNFFCLSPGMPRVTNGYGELEFVITSDTTYILIDHILDDRRIYTDGRSWPAELEPSRLGYSIGHWVDSKDDGHFDVLEVETRGFRGPRIFDDSGLPLHEDNETVVKERIFLDAADRDVAHDEVTVYDHALTRPWTVMKSYRRDSSPHPVWTEGHCENSNHVMIDGRPYMLSPDGYLIPAVNDEPPPDLRYFKKAGQ
ncbi:MAG TPA: hypothetical protein VKW08_23920 [Xanthobacteraceae bacterium]|nr:hypothetical protein [Xanthobacteraceae bacterium]